MAKLRAAILCAGRGVRMRTDTPKSLIPIGNHRPLLYYLLKGLRRADVDDVLVITGYRPSDVEEFVSAHANGMKAAYIRNARYASWGNFHSVRLAIDQSPGLDLLVVNSDIVVHPDVYGRCIEDPADLVLSVQRRQSLDPEDMRVELRGDLVVAIGKHLPLERSDGEFAGVSLLRREAARSFAETATNLEWQAKTSAYYEDVFGSMLAGSLTVRAAPVNDGEYAEVDRPEDVETAAAVIERHVEVFDQEPAADETA